MAEERKCAEENCSGDCGSCSRGDCDPQKEAGNQYSSIKKIIGVTSGKGGVGKSLVTGLAASALAKRGAAVGILDADVTGPSIPKIFGLNDPVYQNELGLIPAKSENGISVMSVNLLLPNADDPVVWRGPVIGGVVKQFYNDVAWGDIDCLFIDMPPGTGDVPLTVYQSLPIDGVIIVTSPQDLVSLIVRKAYNMASLMNVPVLGMVENMSYLSCPDCGKKIYPFGKGKTAETAKKLSIPLFCELPIDPELSRLCDDGRSSKPIPIFSPPRSTR